MVDTSVKVALRIRPLVPTETAKGCQNIIEVYRDINQVRIKTADKAFTYNYVFDEEVPQKEFYTACVKDLIGNLFNGYNVTILAYGQTGSGKTHSMGTAYNGDENAGIIPNAVRDIFDTIKDHFSYDVDVRVSFIEIYQEVVYDLLAMKSRDQCCLEIREDAKGVIMPGLTEVLVTSAQNALEYLIKGSQGRAMASTNMNAQSSRSHAIFTLYITTQLKNDPNSNKTARFHLVDLAGSERQKKTGTTGQTFKEGVNINKGLLALGNVISALGDEKNQNSYIGYRDSCLTRLLKDSLGGNSITLMIACISPADYNVDETLSTLRYADRARRIKNKPIVNQDQKSAKIIQLEKLIQDLRLQLLEKGGPFTSPEIDALKNELSDLKCKNRILNLQLSSCLNENGILHEKLLIVDSMEEHFCKAKEIIEECSLLISSLAITSNGDVKTEFDDNTKLHNNEIPNSVNGGPESGDQSVDQIGKIKEKLSELMTLYNQKTQLLKDISQHETAPEVNANNDDQSDHELSEGQEGHTAHQLALNSEFKEVRRQLAIKEKLVKCMQSASVTVDPNIILECEKKIKNLEVEKDQLQQQLKDMQSNSLPSKVAENRRKRIKGLEEEIQDLRREIVEHNRLVKLKKDDELKIKQLQNEITSMKQNKVALMKKIRQEADRFRTWKLQHDRDVRILKEQDRKKQNQITKMEILHNRQQNVLKRKVEEAAALNKRLKESLAKRKAVIEKRQGKTERIGEWIQQELEVYVNVLDAEHTLSGLLEDRAKFQQQLDLYNQNSSLEEDQQIINQLTDEIQTRSAQIADLQQKLLDSQEDVRSHTRFDNIQNMADAKQALKTLFGSVAEIKRESASNELKTQEQNREIDKLKKDVSSLKQSLKEGEDSKMEIIQNYEEKILLLLSRGKIESQDDNLREMLEIQNKNMHNLQLANERMAKEVAELTTKLEAVNGMAKSIGTPSLVPNESNLTVTVDKKDLKDLSPDVVPATPVPQRVLLHNEVFFSPDIEEDNVFNDPDWHKTPLAIRLKRTSKGGCSCKSNCTSRHCGCRKTTRHCNENCKCNPETCANQEGNTAEQSHEGDQSGSLQNENENSNKRARKTRRKKINI